MALRSLLGHVIVIRPLIKVELIRLKINTKAALKKKHIIIIKTSKYFVKCEPDCSVFCSKYKVQKRECLRFLPPPRHVPEAIEAWEDWSIIINHLDIAIISIVSSINITLPTIMLVRHGVIPRIIINDLDVVINSVNIPASTLCTTIFEYHLNNMTAIITS